MNKKIIIIGGGIAGLSAAIYAIKTGFQPVILERNRHLGGRLRSFYANDLGRTIDNGQHVLSAAYQETFKLLEIIGSMKKVHIQNNFSSLFIKNSTQKFYLKSLPLPSPFHFFIPIFFNHNIFGAYLSDFVNFILKGIKIKKENLKDKTVLQWLHLLGQSEPILKSLWEPLCISITNTKLSEASALLFYNAITKSFFKSKKMAGLALPAEWLGDIFNKPAERYLLKHRGKIFLTQSVLKLLPFKEKINAVQTQKQIFEGSFFIATVPPHALELILRKSNINLLQEFSNRLNQFQYNSIITINLILRSPINERFPIIFINSPVQWLFPYPETKENKYFGYTLVISAANEVIEKSSEEIMEIIKKEFNRLLSMDLNKKLLLNYKIIKEKRATISQTPESLDIKNKTDSPIKNLFWAGDWTDTGLPATIESAILSGRLAVESILKTQHT